MQEEETTPCVLLPALTVSHVNVLKPDETFKDYSKEPQFVPICCSYLSHEKVT